MSACRSRGRRAAAGFDPPQAPVLAELIRHWCARDPDRNVLTFVWIGSRGELLDEGCSYRRLWDNGRRLAAALQGAGLCRGETFALMMQNHPEFVEAMVASSIAGTVYVPVDPRTRGDKLRYMLDFAECRGIICADYVLPQVLEVRKALARLSWVWVLDTGAGYAPAPGAPGVRALAEVLPAGVPDLPVAVQDPQEPMQMLYTSGTTGDPKAILASYARFHGIATLGEAIGLRPYDRPYTGLSLTHANAQIITLGNLLAHGLRGVISRRFTKSRLWEIVRAYRCTTFNLLGGMATAIYSEPPRRDDADNPVRYVLSAGMPAAIWEEFSRRFGVEVFEFYGTAEGGLCMNPPGAGPIGSIGKPPPQLVAKVVDERDEECPARVPGELVFRNADGTPMEVRYFKNPQASAEKTRGGWLRTGDVCSRDEEGWLYFHWRKGSGIRRNGEFVDAGYVERAIGHSGMVDDVFVYGVPAASGAPGEKDVIAAVVPRDPGTFDAHALFGYLRQQLDPNSQPVCLQVLDEIPKTASEKPQERFCAELLTRQPERIWRDPEAAGVGTQSNIEGDVTHERA